MSLQRLIDYAKLAAPGFLGGFLGVVLTSTVAEYIRLEIQKDGYPTPVERVLGIQPSKYGKFPIEWRQLLAQVAMEPENYAGQTVKVLSGLSLEQAAVIEKIATHVLGGDFLIRDNDSTTKHPIADVTLHDLLDLEGIGILQTVATGLEMTITSTDPEQFKQVVRTRSHVLSIEDGDPSKKLHLAITSLTNSGKEIVELLQKPSDVDYLVWVAKHIRTKGFETKLWASWTDPKGPKLEWQAKHPIVFD